MVFKETKMGKNLMGKEEKWVKCKCCSQFATKLRGAKPHYVMLELVKHFHQL